MDKKYNKRKLFKKNGEVYEKTTLSTLKKDVTNRGFGIWEFYDMNGHKCSLQDSSVATEPVIWLGVDDVDPTIKGENGWEPYNDIPKKVLLHSRMHLTQEQVKTLLPVLKYFAETGDYIKNFEEEKE
jgi:hypothetical protein